MVLAFATFGIRPVNIVNSVNIVYSFLVAIEGFAMFALGKEQRDYFIVKLEQYLNLIDGEIIESCEK